MPPDERQDIDGLLAPKDGRVRKWSRMIAPSGPLAPERIDGIRASLQQYMETARISQAAVAKAIGASSTYVNNWLEAEGRAQAASVPDTFVQTVVAKRLIAVADRLSERHDMALAYGPAGIGKSLTIGAITAERKWAVAIRATRQIGTRASFRAALFKLLRRRNSVMRPELMYEAVIDRLRKEPAVSTHPVLIIDQAQELTDQVWSLLMAIHDEARCSILLVGTVDLVRRLSSDDDPEFGQLSSRVGMRIDLTRKVGAGRGRRGGPAVDRLFTVEEIRAIFHRDNLRVHPDVTKMLWLLACSHNGHLRTVDRLFYWAAAQAEKSANREVTMDHLRLAAELRGEELPALPEHHTEEFARVAAGGPG